MANVWTGHGPHPVDRHVGRRMREKRTSLGYNQRDLGRGLGLTFQQIQKYESGANRISASKLWDAARFFGVDIRYFFEGLANEGGTEPTASRFGKPPSPSSRSREIILLASHLSARRQKLVRNLITSMMDGSRP